MVDNITLKKVQKCQLEIIKEIDRICQKNNLTYYLCAGTLLGAIRHQGFIPWDDDLDIEMPRRDFEVLIKILEVELDERYQLDWYSTNKKYWLPFAKIRKKGTVYKENAQRVLDDRDCGIWIDIFPLDNAFSEKALGNKVRKFVTQSTRFCIQIKTLKMKLTSFSRRWVLGVLIWYLVPKNILIKIQQSVMKGINNEGGSYYISLASTYNLEKETYLKTDYGQGKKVQFEDIELYIPKNYDKILRKVYGNYMELPPIEKRINHGAEKIIC